MYIYEKSIFNFDFYFYIYFIAFTIFLYRLITMRFRYYIYNEQIN